MSENINQLGKDIQKCTSSYNRAIGTMEKRVMPTARKLEEMDISNLQVEELKSIDRSEANTKEFNKRFQDHEK